MAAFFYQPRSPEGKPLPPLTQRLQALRHLPPFLSMMWGTCPRYAAAIVALRLVNAFTPVVTLWIGKLLVDSVVASVRAGMPEWGHLVWLVGA